MEKQVTIIGNNVASLVAGIALAEQGYDINIINPLPSWGGHFGGATVQDAYFDYGMTFFEFDSFQTTQSYDVLSYDSNVRNDCGRFTSLVKNYVEQLITTRPLPQPKMFYNGMVVNDLMVTNDLTGLMALGDEIKKEIKKELTTILNTSEKSLHAANKLKSSLFLLNSLYPVSLANHGQRFHHLFIESFLNKVSFKTSKDLLALYHRVFWLPLYYPETLLSQFTSVPQKLKSTQFHYPNQGYMGAFINALLMKAQSYSRINLIKKKLVSLSLIKQYKLFCQDGSVFETDKIVWSLDLSFLFNLMGKDVQNLASERASITFCFIGILSKMLNLEYSTLFVLDKEYVCYRITNQNMCAGSSEPITKIVVELNADYALEMQIIDELKLQNKIEDELIKLNIIETKKAIKYFEVKHAKNALIIPTKHNYDRFFTDNSTVIEHCPNIKLTGAASGFMSTSLNDQIIQGLQVAKQLED